MNWMRLHIRMNKLDDISASTFQSEYRDWLLYISTSFRLLRTPKSWSKYFFQPFQTFMFILNLFQWFHPWNKWKTSENERVFPSKLADKQKLVDSLGGTSKSSCSVDLQKRLKTAGKKFSTCFRVRATPKSWSKYTTIHSSLIFVSQFSHSSSKPKFFPVWLWSWVWDWQRWEVSV